MSVTIAPTAPQGNLGLRILRFPVVLIVLEGAIFSVLFGSLEAASAVKHMGLSAIEYFLVAVIECAALILGWKASRRWLEGERDREYTLRGAGLEVGAGLISGSLLFTMMTGLVWLLGGIQFVAVRPFAQTQFWEWAGIGLASGVFEETLMRGILLRQLERLVGTWWALAATAFVFGALHLHNPDATWVGAASIMVEAGVLLGAAYLYTRRLWLAGIHAAWNFTQAWVFSVPVSGTGQPVGWLVTRRTGPEWLTGGDFGLEASLAAVWVATAAGVILLWLAHRRGSFIRPPWARAHARSQMKE